MRKIKIIFISVFCFTIVTSYAQKANWQNLDLQKDTVLGISTERAYSELLKGKKAQTVIVAVIDDGIDTAHEDLKANIWTNPVKDKLNDIHGWNFIGSAKGNVNFDNTELVRLLKKNRIEFSGADSTMAIQKDPQGYLAYRKEEADYNKQLNEAKAKVRSTRYFKSVLDTVLQTINQSKPTIQNFRDFKPGSTFQSRVRDIVVGVLQNNTDYDQYYKANIADVLKHYQDIIDYHLSMDYDPRAIVGDNYSDDRQSDYGNNNVTGPDAHHGTHVAGIIGAVRDNGLGIQGIADHVQLMSVRAIPDGDERDKDIANSICYATDHGAKIINMSFGKAYSWDKQVVDDAVKYAMSKGVLIVHAAGNEDYDRDTVTRYPTRVYADGSGAAQAWIEVGASGWNDDNTIKASFSNYGKKTVDVFAPGEKIYSTIPGNKYAAFDGTSMAAPVVSGLAALIWEYYPKLTAFQVKEIIMKSVYKVNHDIIFNDGHDMQDVPFSDMCITGGIVNTYNALKLAATYK